MIASGSAAAEPFNLTCSGTMTTVTIDGKRAEPYNSTYRLDLDRGKWCEGECKALFEIESVQPTQLTLLSKEVDTPSERSTTSNFIDRETGAHHALATSANPRDRRSTITIAWSGQCTKAPFGGFPAFETAF
jgi:hypothetical protein